MAKHFAYYDFDQQAQRTCACGWSGVPGFGELYRELVEVECPSCHEVMAIVTLPTGDETRAAAAAGNALAIADLSQVDERETFLAEAAATELKTPDQLPELPGTDIVVDWDLVSVDGDCWTVLRCGTTELWRERAYWEGHRRFEKVFNIVRERYGEHLAELRPTEASQTWLYGDTLWAPDHVDRLNASLRAG